MDDSSVTKETTNVTVTCSSFFTHIICLSILFFILQRQHIKMKIFVLIALSLAVCATAEEKYTTKYDNIDVDEILKSDRLFTNYFKCLVDTGKCTPDGRELKKTLPDALKTECSKCSEKQKQNTDKVIRFIIDNKPEEWKVLQEKYDPEDIYIKRYRSHAAEAGIKI